MVEELVREFASEAMVDGLDFDRMERVSTKFYATTGLRRESDVIWRLPTNNGTDIYLYIMIEFQSKSDPWMAVRTLVYQGLLWQQMISEKSLKSGDRLPPLMMIVLHNGGPRWSAPTDTANLVSLPADSLLWAWQPRAQYHLIDMGDFSADTLASRENAAALLFRLERRQEDPDALAALIGEVITWFRRHPDHEQLKQVFTELAKQATKGLAPDLPLPEDLIEMQTVLSTQGQVWRDQWKAEGRAEGEAKGRAEGKAEGEAEGLHKGQALALLRQLDRRFGPLSDTIRDQVGNADPDTIGLWLERVLDAQTIDAVFNDAAQ